MSWKEESLLVGEPWGGERREEMVPLAQGKHSSLALGKQLPQKALCTMREEKATQSHGREQPCLHCSHLPGQSCCAGGNLSCSPGLLSGRTELGAALPASLLHSSFCSQSHPAVTSAVTPQIQPQTLSGYRETESSQDRSCARTENLDLTPSRKIHQPRECLSSITPRAQENRGEPEEQGQLRLCGG